MKRIFGSRRDHVLARVCVFLIIAALISGMIGCDGGGSRNLEIQDWYDLDAVRNNLAGSHILMNDLDSITDGYEELASPTANGGHGWQPIGNFDNKFTGRFAGQGYEIRDFYINLPYEAFVGLFGYVRSEGVIQDIGVVNATVNGQIFVGGLVGSNYGTLSNSYTTGSVTGRWTVGGLVGHNHDGSLSNCHSTANVAGNTEVGGLVGINKGTVSNSYSTGSVIGHHVVGGLVGENSGCISNSHYNYDEVLIKGGNIITIGALFGEDFEEWLANGKFLDINERLSQEDGYYVVNDITDFKQLLAFGQDDTLKFRLKNDLDLTSEPDFYIPYLAGEFDGNGHKISNLSVNFGFVHTVGLFGRLARGGKVTDLAAENVNITGGADVGGLVGSNSEGTISNSYTTGSVTGGLVGGLVGENNGTISDSYSTSSVTGVIVGGLVGINSGILSNSYSTGDATGDWYAGGLVAINSHTVSDSYSTGSVTGNLSVGGLVGENIGTISNSYSSGNVTGNSSVGGLVGWNEDEDTVGNSFWDIETSGQAASAGGTGKNTTEMQDFATFSGAGWDIIAVANPSTRNLAYIWNIVSGVTYPFLNWRP